MFLSLLHSNDYNLISSVVESCFETFFFRSKILMCACFLYSPSFTVAARYLYVHHSLLLMSCFHSFSYTRIHATGPSPFVRQLLVYFFYAHPRKSYSCSFMYLFTNFSIFRRRYSTRAVLKMSHALVSTWRCALVPARWWFFANGCLLLTIWLFF